MTTREKQQFCTTLVECCQAHALHHRILYYPDTEMGWNGIYHVGYESIHHGYRLSSSGKTIYLFLPIEKIGLSGKEILDWLLAEKEADKARQAQHQRELEIAELIRLRAKYPEV